MSEEKGSEQQPTLVATSRAVLGYVLAELRRRRKLTQAQFAEQLGLAGSTWSRVEKGETSLTVEQLRAAADRLGISAASLLNLAAKGEEAVRRYGKVIGAPKTERRRVGALSGVVGAMPGTFYTGILPLIGATLGAILGEALGAAIEKALATGTPPPPTE
ncbi:MAG: helix-turn-helix domain-containing protein [Acidiferrobacter thiooxydans]